MPILAKETKLFPDTLLESAEFEPGTSQRRWWAILSAPGRRSRWLGTCWDTPFRFFYRLSPSSI